MNNINTKNRISKRASKLILYVVLLAVTVITLLPILYAVMGSFRENMDFTVNGGLFSKKLTLENYKKAFTMMNFGRSLFNSLFVSTAATVINCFISAMAGFLFARKDFYGKKLIFSVMTGMMFIAMGGATLYPKYKLFKDLHIINTYAGLIFSSVGGIITNVFLIKSYLDGISNELDEAAKIDGCGIYRLFFRILFPLMAPMLVVIMIMRFKGVWNEYLFPMLISAQNTSIQPLSVAVIALKNTGQAASETTLMLAGVTLSLAPMIFMFIFFNRYFTEGLTAGAVKG